MSPLQIHNTPRKLRARSVNGCWTCRLRKKKCDETSPSCTACNILGIDCHGYGRRPDWMDKGSSQHAELERLKRAISNRGPKKCLGRRQSDMAQHNRRAINIQPSAALSNGEPVNHNNPCHGLVTPELASHRHCDMSETSNMFSFDSGLVDDMDIRLSLLTGDTTSAMDAEILGLQSPALDGIYPQLEDSSSFNFDDGSLSVSSTGRTSEDESGLAGGIRDQPLTLTPMETVATPSGTTPASHGLLDTADPDAFSLLDSTYQEGDSLDDAFIIAYYTDNLYEIQFPFVVSDEVQRDKHGAGWLLYLLLRSRAARKATVILAEAHKSIKDGTASSEERSRFLLLAKRFAAKMSSPPTMTTRLDTCREPLEIIEDCFTRVQIMILQSLYGKYTDWAGSLKSAAQPLGVLIRIIRGDASLGNSAKTLNSTHAKAAAMILAYHLWFDLLATLLFRQSSFLGIEIGPHLQFCANELGTITGCELWVIQCVRDILHLDVWRRQLEAQKRLSIIELAHRGLKIHERLKHGLAGLQKEDLATRGPGAAVTSIFAHTAATYLNVVFSGPNPALLEIRAAASRVLEEFYGLAHTIDVSTLPALAWPLCLAGCFLGEEGRSKLRGTLTDLRGGCGAPQGRCQILRIVEECWRIRTKGRDCDWSLAIHSLHDI